MPKQITEAHLKHIVKKAEAARQKITKLKEYKPKDVEAWKIFKKVAALVEHESDTAVAHMPSRTTTQRFARVMAKAKYIRDNERRFIEEAKISPAMEERLRAIAEDPNLPND
jgi:hypothetical protein